MKAFRKSRFAQANQAGLILLFAEKLIPLRGTTTSAFKPVSWLQALNLAPAFPAAHSTRVAQWLLGVCSLLQWRNRSGFSPDSLTFDCDKDELAFTVFKERSPFRTDAARCQELSEHFLPQYFTYHTSPPPVPFVTFT